MQNLDAGTVRDCFNSADELYEVLKLTTQAAVYEVVQTTHDELHQYIVVRYMNGRIMGGELFKNPDSAKLRIMELLTHANLTA